MRTLLFATGSFLLILSTAHAGDADTTSHLQLAQTTPNTSYERPLFSLKRPEPVVLESARNETREPARRELMKLNFGI